MFRATAKICQRCLAVKWALRQVRYKYNRCDEFCLHLGLWLRCCKLLLLSCSAEL